MNICKDCFCILRKREIIYIDDKYIMIPMILYLCSDCYEKHYIYNKDSIKTATFSNKHFIVKDKK
jgi:hypothetical protein